MTEADLDIYRVQLEEAIVQRDVAEWIDNVIIALRDTIIHIDLLEAANREADGPRQEQLTSAELRVQLEEMTRREAMWRKEAMRLGSEQAQASVQSFSEFCDGHKAGMRKALEVR